LVWFPNLYFNSSSLFGSILSSGVQCSSFEPVHSAIIESYQTKCLIWSHSHSYEVMEGGTGGRKLVCARPFASLLRIYSSPRAPSPICALLSGTSPTPVRRRFSLTQEFLDRVIPGGEGPGDRINVRRREVYFSAIPYSTYDQPRKLQWYWTYLRRSFSSSSAAITSINHKPMNC